MIKAHFAKVFFCFYLFGVIFFLFSCNNGIPDVSKYPNDEKGNSEKVKILTNYINSNKKSSDAYFLRSQAYSALKSDNPAVEDLKMAIQLDSNNIKYLRYGAQLFEKLPYIKGALAYYYRLSILEPKNPQNFLKLGELHFYVKERELSMENLAKAVEIDQYLKEPYYFRGLNFKEMKKEDEAIRSFSTVLDIDPQNYGALMQLGYIFSKKKDMKAVAYYSRAIQSNLESREAYYARGYFFQSIDSFESAIKDYQKILEINNDDKNANYNLGFIYFKQKKFEKSEAFFSKAITTDENYAEAWYGRGNARIALGKKTEGSYDIEHSKKLSPLYGEEEYLKSKD